MKNNIKITTTFLLLLGIIIIPSFISAEESGTDPRPQPPRPELRGEVKNMRVETRGEIKEIRKDNQDERGELRKERREQVATVRQNASSTTQRPPAELKVLREQNKAEITKIREDFSAAIKANKASTTEAIKEKREYLIKGIQEKRELFKEELESRKEYRASTTAAMKAKFKEGLAKIKDEKKKIKIENVANNITELNTKITTKSSEKIDKIEEILIAIESRADKAAARGISVSGVRSLVVLAETAIAEARTAITTQASKTYTVSVTDESTVKTSVQTTRDLLKKDIEAMNVKIKAAHEATRKAVSGLRTIPKIDNDTATSTVATTTVSTTTASTTTN